VDNTFGPLGKPRRPAHWALLHAGAEFLPVRDRKIIWRKADGLSVAQIAKEMGVSELDIQNSLARSARTLAIWERGATRWATRYVAREPMAQAPGAMPERDIRRSSNQMVEA
jgi:transposase